MSSYFRRNPWAPVAEHRRRWLTPQRAHRRTATANKFNPLEYKNTDDQRVGYDWFCREKRRGLYRHWPWVRMSDDLLREHVDPSSLPSRAFSVRYEKAKQDQIGEPLWNYYEETGRDYEMGDHCPLHLMAPFINVFAGKIWNLTEIESKLKLLESKGNWPTIGDIASDLGGFESWNEKTGTLPMGLVSHIKMLAVDIVTQNSRKAYRIQKHKEGVLRDRHMSRYFTLPYMRSGPAVPVALKQPVGVYPSGDFLMMNDPKKIKVHPLQPIDGHSRKNYYPL
eukprot:Tbor_TRINITY_DN732_c0_g1::TRINITY_DN732_c0_g1_i1::g.3345::m.3345